MVKFIESKHINKQKWDDLINENPTENIFLYSWYLDAVSDNWGGVVMGDYQTIFPITYSKKLGVNQFYQAFFTRQFEVIGEAFNLSDVLTFIKSDFKMVDFRSQTKLPIDNKERIHQFLHLNTELNFSTNAKRLIKKADKYYTFKVIDDIEGLMNLIKNYVAHKIAEFTPENLDRLNRLMLSASEAGKGELIGAFNETGELVAAGFFFKNKNTITYLKGASNDEAKKNGVMFGLIDFAINLYKPDFSTFDFGGSNVDNVAQFYRKFGAKDKIYYNYTINDLPLWFKGLKKMKR